MYRCVGEEGSLVGENDSRRRRSERYALLDALAHKVAVGYTSLVAGNATESPHPAQCNPKGERLPKQVVSGAGYEVVDREVRLHRDRRGRFALE